MHSEETTGMPQTLLAGGTVFLWAGTRLYVSLLELLIFKMATCMGDGK